MSPSGLFFYWRAAWDDARTIIREFPPVIQGILLFSCLLRYNALFLLVQRFSQTL